MWHNALFTKHWSRYILTWFVAAPMALLLTHTGVKSLLLPSLFKAKRRRVAIVGANQAGQALRARICGNPYLNMEFVGFFDDRELNRLEGITQADLLCTLNQMPEYIAQNDINRVYISLPMSSQPRVMKLLDSTKTARPPFIPPRLLYLRYDTGSCGSCGGHPSGLHLRVTLPRYQSRDRRASDVVFGLMILALIWPIMLATAVAVKVTSPGPVIFKQRRYGADGKGIMVYKFRSMTVMEDGAKVTQAQQNDQRFTPHRRFLAQELTG